MEYNEIGKLVNQGTATLNNLAQKIEGARLEGRNNEWFFNQKKQLSEAAAAELKKIRNNRTLTMIQARAANREKQKPSNDYQARAYNLQKASSLLGGLTKAEEVLSMFEKVLQDPEANKFKHEYETIAAAKLGPAEQYALQQVKLKYSTPEEVAAVEEAELLNQLDYHIEAVAGYEEMALEEVSKGHKMSNDPAKYFFDSLENVQAQMNRWRNLK